jgi:hypothetical protein
MKGAFAQVNELAARKAKSAMEEPDQWREKQTLVNAHCRNASMPPQARVPTGDSVARHSMHTRGRQQRSSGHAVHSHRSA